MADTTNASLTPEAIRLECLRLAHRPDRDAQTTIDRAAQYERFVSGSEPPAVETPSQTDKPTAKARSKSS